MNQIGLSRRNSLSAIYFEVIPSFSTFISTLVERSFGGLIFGNSLIAFDAF